MTFDYMSDWHLDFWVKLEHAPHKMEQKIRNFVESILPKHPSDTLIIAGDLGHYNIQNRLLITILKETYETIFYVFGNHDYYLISKKMKQKYRISQNRVAEMEQMLDEIEGVHRLDGNVILHKGIKMGGCNMWYDLSYSKEKGMSEKDIYQYWWDESNDVEFHQGLPHPKDFAESEKEKIMDIDCDIFVSHVPPIGIRIPNVYVEEKDVNFYTFDASNLFQKKKPKIWLSGHMHQTIEQDWNGITLLSHALGYPEKENKKKIPPHTIKQYAY